MQYIIIKDGIVTEHGCGSTLPEGAQQVVDFPGVVGLPLAYYKDDWSMKSQAELIREGLESVPEGFRFDGEELVELTYEEKVAAGLEELPPGMKLEDGKLLPATDEELLAAGRITQEAYNERKRGAIAAELDALDARTVRPLRAILSGNGTDEDKFMLGSLEGEAIALRAKLAEFE